MIRMLKTVTVFFLLMIYSGCIQQSEDETYQNAMGIDSEKERVAALNDFLQDFPASKNKDKVLFRIFRDHIILKNEKSAVSTASEYLNLFPEDSRISRYNSVSWILAENLIGLDSAKVYADKAVELAKSGDERRLNSILDTQAFVYFQAGDAAKALSIQEKAMKGNENSADYLNRLAQYQNGSGHLYKSLETISRSIVLGGGLDSQLKFQKWINENDVNIQKRKEIVKKIIDELNRNGLTSENKSQGAVLLALAEVDLKKSEKWAQEAVSSIDKNTSFEDQLYFHQNLATVFNANGKNKAALDALIPVEEIASIYDSAYWLNLGNAYANNDNKEKAINAYVNGMLWQVTPEIFDAASLLGFTKETIERKINQKKQELMNFHPGYLDKSDSFSGKVVLAELFTGAECPPCKGADLAVDLIAEYYPRSMVAILEYHLHIPGPDPLTNGDSEFRKDYYGGDFGTPTIFINGQRKKIGGGSELAKRDIFNNYKKSIEKIIKKNPEIKLTLLAEKKDQKIDFEAAVDILNSNTRKMKLHVALVEKSVNYIGGNGVTKHAFVVRYLVTGEKGQEVEFKNSKFELAKNFDLNDVEKRQNDYLNNFSTNPPSRYRNFAGWKERKDKLDDSNLAIVAWIQDKNKDVLQAYFLEL